jgi:hypothetical protein
MRTRAQTLLMGWVAVAAVLALLLAVFDGPGGRRAVLVSATIAVVVLVMAFLLARLAAPGNVMKAWIAGAGLRFLTLVVYALVLLKPLGLPAVPALMSLVSLLFVTTVLESLLLTSS